MQDILAPPTGPQHIEHLYIDENPLVKAPRDRGHFGPFPMKNGSDIIYYGTGIAYMSGLTLGSAYGVWRGLVTAKVPNWTVRTNNVVNQVGRYVDFSLS